MLVPATSLRSMGAYKIISNYDDDEIEFDPTMTTTCKLSRLLLCDSCSNTTTSFDTKSLRMYEKSQLVHGFDPKSFVLVNKADSTTRPPTLNERFKETTDNRSTRIRTLNLRDFIVTKF